MSIPSDQLELYNNLIAEFGKLERKGKTTPYTSFNGHMTSFLDKSGVMGLRLSTADIEAFVSKHNSKLMEQHGRVMKDFVLIPVALLVDKKSMLDYLEASYNHAASLKPKPTRKK